MKSISQEGFEGFALYCNKNKPLGIVSQNGDHLVLCNSKTLPLTLKNYLVEIEDKRFYTHSAIDIRAISRAIYQNLKAGKVVQGGSTITQQLARNILKDNRKHIFRKFKETQVAFELENKYSKDEILDLYFNHVFWGKKNYGLRSASLEYFFKEPESLSSKEQLVLLTMLRGPNYYINNDILLDKRCNLLGEILYKREILNSTKYNKLKKTKVKVQNNPLEVFRAETLPFITKDVCKNKKTIITTLDNELQHKVTKFINSSKYPTSVIVVSGGRVVSLGSSQGSNYPLTYKSNVGSTLKPFIYTILRSGGIQSHERFSTSTKNGIDWDIREGQIVNAVYLSLEDALFNSNNNCFVNAAFDFGIDRTLLSLSKILNKSIDNFVPSSILGATINGLTLYELLMTYNRFFKDYESNTIKKECFSILERIAKIKFNGEIENAFLKTGTTNFNKERFAIVGYANKLFGFLRQDSETSDYTKEGRFISSILEFLKAISIKNYKW